jgi:GGDEF domain-containing protein
VEKSKLLGEDKPLTVSLGVSTYPLDGANEDELIEKADQALYYSKNNGRNKSTSWDNNLIKEGHRYDRLTGILTGNMSSDTRHMQAILDIMNQLNHQIDRESSILNAFISLLDITEGEEIQFLKFDAEDRLIETFFKRKGQADLSEELVLSDRLLVQFKSMKAGHYFIDWEEQQIDMTDKEMLASSMPDWKSYIALRFQHEGYTGILAISVSISIKEFDFSNYNFVDSLRPILEHLFL